jgi:hypothetical protein
MIFFLAAGLLGGTTDENMHPQRGKPGGLPEPAGLSRAQDCRIRLASIALQ